MEVSWERIVLGILGIVGPLVAGWFVYREKKHGADMEALKAKYAADASIEKDKGGNDNAARGELYKQLFALVGEHKTEIANLKKSNEDCERRGEECEQRDREKEVRLARLELEFRHVTRKVDRIEESVNVPAPPQKVEHAGLILSPGSDPK